MLPVRGADADTDTNATSRFAPEFSRLFDFVEVPSRFVGTEMWYNQRDFLAQNEPTSDWLTSGFRPPFHKLSRFRYPGLVNINTIFDQNIWRAITSSFGPAAPTWNSIVRHRRGFASNATVGPVTPPTEYTNPFRSASGARLQRELIIEAIRGMGSGASQANELGDVDATLLRREHLGGSRDDILLGNLSTLQYNNTRKNPYFRYENMQRLANLLTTRSNVFAVWVTVGYFEVNYEPDALTGQVQPKLGQELNGDTGDVKPSPCVLRHRSFGSGRLRTRPRPQRGQGDRAAAVSGIVFEPRLIKKLHLPSRHW